MNKANQRTGKRYENIALTQLTQIGLTFIARNINYRCGEIDLIMKDGTTIVFIEVRFRRTEKFGDALTSITPYKQKRLLKAAEQWLIQINMSLITADCRFDVFAITGNKVEWIPNALHIDSDNLDILYE